MAEQKSRLVLEIDSRDAEQKAEDVRKSLGALEDAGIRVKPAMDKAGAGIDGVGKTATKAGESLGQLGKSADGSAKSTASSSESYAEASTRLLAMATNSLQASDYVKALSASTTSASVSFDAASDKIRSITSLSARFRAESDALAGSTDKASVSTRNASVATDLQAKELTELLGKINPAVAALGRLDDMQSKLGQFHKAGLLDSETFKDYSTRLDSTRQGLSAFDEGLSKTGISAKQTESALRQLPMQFSDIFTSLAAGQNPLLVLLQQGSQIKDSFGGVGNTVDVLGGKVKGFFSSIAGSSAGIAGAGAALGELASQQNAVAESTEAAADGLGGMADSANTAADASKNAKEAADALGLTGVPVSAGLGLIIAAATASAAALALMIYGYNKGSQEADAFNKALILTGNFAGTSSDQLADLAMQVSAVNGTTGQAAEILAGLAGSGKIASESFETIANAAIAMEDATGKSVDATITEFVKISKDPVSAAKELNDQYHFLTASVYSQIAALKEQGDTIGAADLLTKTYSDTVQDRSRQITDNLGTIERAWKGIKDAAAGALDATLNVGRTLTMEQQAQVIRDRLATNKGRGGRAAALGLDTRDTAKDQATLAYLELQIDAEKTKNTYLGEQRKIQEDAVGAQIKVDALTKSSLTNEQKRTEAVKEYRKQLDSIRKANPDDARLIQGVIDKNIANINEKFKDVKTPKDKPYTEDAGQKMLDEARQRFAVLQQQGQAITDQTNGTTALGTEAKKLIELETMLANLKTKGTLTASQKQLLAMGELNAAQQRLNAGLEEQNKLASVQVQNAAKLKAYQDNLTSRLDSSQEELNSRLAGTGLGGEAKSRLQEDLKIQQDYQKRLNKLTNDYTNSTDKSPGRTKLYDDEVALEKAALDKRVEQQKGYYASLDELRGNWLAGASTAWQSYLEIATNYNQQTQEATAQLLGDTTSSISDQIQGLVKGTTSLGDAFGNLAGTMSGSVLQALSDIAAKWVVVHALKMAGITAETGAVVTSEGIKTTAKLTTDAVSTSSTLAAIATTLAANVSAAATTIASWLPAALVASIGSFGAAAVVGGTALIAAYALIKGFSSGGYTGAGGVNEPAGMVHKGEVVWSQADISRFGGVAAVESLRKGNVTPIGAARSGSSGSSGLSSGPTTVQQNVQIFNNSNSQVRTKQDEKGRLQVIIDAVREDFLSGVSSGDSSYSRAIEGTYHGMRRGA
ncbi:phage tail length tape measure family protein [Pseudomonas kulmbachensis]|uniref:phage tail length tape measure family protein n=1 Tax=Pseudomonas kulmbachensis TaxID=3043408 RepID=UPI002AB29A73|nr:phage tail length tape measure family protein [Pseudomonas sp. V3/3/4/13]